MGSMTEHPLIWCEISRDALDHNLKIFRNLVGKGVRLAPVVKSNAYGHGLVPCAQTFIKGKADGLCVNALYEAQSLRTAGLECPIYVLGYIPLDDIEQAVDLDCRFVVYNLETVEKVALCAVKMQKKSWLHLKIETGTNRQGLTQEEAVQLAKRIVSSPYLELEGVTMHFADIEDTTDHSFAREQLKKFTLCIQALADVGIHIPFKHCSNSAATILWPNTYLDLVRVGIGCYGMWPSKETLATAILEMRHRIELRPAITWKTKIAQIKKVPEGDFIGYGRTYQTTLSSKLAILPVGYYDGYDRKLSNLAYVLIHGRRAPIRGRICMNITMIDVTHIPDVSLEDEVVLLGRQGNQEISAEQMAQWIGTINYEITTRINERIPRILV
jgi:alanine racemase